MSNATWQDAFDEHHQFDVYPDHFMTGLRNEFCAGWHAALKSIQPRFPETFCSQCGKSLGAGDSGVSHCGDHK